MPKFKAGDIIITKSHKEKKSSLIALVLNIFEERHIIDSIECYTLLVLERSLEDLDHDLLNIHNNKITLSTWLIDSLYEEYQQEEGHHAKV